MRKSDGAKAIEKLAVQKGISAAEVRREIENAIDIGMANPDPTVQAYWAKIPKESETPTPEEVIVFIAKNIKPKIGPLSLQ